MQGSRTILVPTDFQDASLEALAVAREFAGMLGLEIVLLHAYTIPMVISPEVDPIPFLTAEEVAANAKNALAKLAAAEGVVRSILRAGDPATEILRTISELMPTLVAMGTHGRTGLRRLLLGSVAETIARTSPVPVLIVRAKPSPNGGGRGRSSDHAEEAA